MKEEDKEHKLGEKPVRIDDPFYDDLPEFIKSLVTISNIQDRTVVDVLVNHIKGLQKELSDKDGRIEEIQADFDELDVYIDTVVVPTCELAIQVVAQDSRLVKKLEYIIYDSYFDVNAEESPEDKEEENGDNTNT